MNQLDRVFHEQELDPDIRRALAGWLNRSPSRHEIEAGIASIAARRPAAPARARQPNRRSAYRWLMMTAASSAFALMWMGAQSQLWADVAADFQISGSGDSIPTTTAKGNDGLHSGMRFLLLLHVASLLLGLLGLVAGWCFSQARWAARRCGSDRLRFTTLWQRRALASAICLYAAGIGLGCVWAKLSWGSIWRWDPKESFALITLGISVLWYLQPEIVHSSSARWDLERRPALTAAVAFWLIALGMVLAPLYASDQHSYGASWLLNVIAMIAAANVACIVIVGTKWRSAA